MDLCRRMGLWRGIRGFMHGCGWRMGGRGVGIIKDRRDAAHL